MKDFTRKPAREKMARILVHLYGQTGPLVTFASFRQNFDANQYYDQLRKEHPTWKLELRYGTMA